MTNAILNKKLNDLKNVDIISDEKIKSDIIKKSIFAIVKSGTVSLEVCKQGIPSIIIDGLSRRDPKFLFSVYKMPTTDLVINKNNSFKMVSF